MKKALATAAIMDQMMQELLQTKEPKLKNPVSYSKLVMPAAKYKARKKRMAIQKTSRKINRP